MALATSILGLLSCTNTDFSGASGKPSKPNADAQPLPSPDADDASKCWFAVSGTCFGHSVGFDGQPISGSTFPETLTGNPIKTGEGFDPRAGGVFLNARAEPYEYKKGGGEIDKAVDASFDSIAVSPGVSIEMRNGSGKVIYQGNGPYIAVSSACGAPSYKVVFIEWLKSRKSKMPAWMVTYLEATSFSPIVLEGMTSAFNADVKTGVTWVKVTKRPGVSCDK
jgi:hypothetical protein